MLISKINITKLAISKILIALFIVAATNSLESAPGIFKLRPALELIGKKTQRYNGGFAFIAEAERGDIRAAIVWPILINQAGEILDDDIMVFTFRKQGGKYLQIKGRLPVKLSQSNGRKKLENLMEGSDYTLIKPDGISISELPKYIRDHSISFHKALKSKKYNKAINQFEKLSHAFGMNLAGFDDTLTEMVIKKTFANSPKMIIENLKIRAGRAIALIVLTIRNKKQKARAQFVKSGTGWALDKFY